MNSLAHLQQRFLARMQGRPARDDREDIADGAMPRELGLRIYRHAYRARLSEALDNDHPVLGTYLGDELWQRMCAGYIDAHPSRYRSLRDFGASVPAYLARAEPFAAYPLLSELAAFERTLLDSFDAADAARADWSALAAREAGDWPGLRLCLHPSLRVHRVARNSVETWRAIKDRAAPPQVAEADCAAWAVWRGADRVSLFRSLDEEEHAALAHFIDGGDFAGLCQRLIAWYPPEAVPAAALGHLRAWCADGWISAWR